MICQIIDSVDNHFGEYLWHFLVVRLYSWHNSKEPADCKLIHETVQHAELCQTRDAIQWHPAPLLRHNKGKAGKFYIIIITDRFYIALFSATFEQTRCARMWFYMSE